MPIPTTTRLRFVTAKTPELIVMFLDRLGRRVQIYGAPVFDGKRWVCWFVPDDHGADIKSVHLK